MKMKSIKEILLNDLKDSEFIQQDREDDESRLISQYTSFIRKLGEAGTDEED